MRNHHPARLGGCARGENDLHDVVAREWRQRDGLIGVRRDLPAQRFQVHLCDTADAVLHGAKAEPGIHLLRYAVRKIQNRNLVDGNHDSAAQ